MMLKLICLSAVLLTSMAQSVSPQKSSPQGKREDWLDSLPAPQREAFSQRFENVIGLREQGSWLELYQLRQDVNGISKAQFVKRMNGLDALIRFQPSSLFYVPPSHGWLIKGCARYRSKTRGEYVAPSSMRAYSVKGQWLFTELAVDVLKSPADAPSSCQS
jgi:hypothetical protein